MAQQYQADHFWQQIFNEKNTGNNSATTSPFSTAAEYLPKCDLYECEEELVVEVETPGLKKEDLYISINQQILTITGEFKSFKTNNKYFLKERANRKFKKELTLPYPIKINSVRSELSSGILTINMIINRDEIESVPISFDESTSE